MAIKDTRAEAHKRLTAVQRKVARLRREKGVEIAGTNFDPRIDRARISKMSTRELNRFIANANAFTDRRVQYVAGHKGAPLDASVVRRLQRKESAIKAQHDEIMQNIGTIEAPFTGMSISQREQMRPTVKAGGEAFTRTFSPELTNIGNVVSNEALAKLEEWRDKQMAPDYARSRINSSRDEANAMLKKIGLDDLTQRFKALSDEQFFIMWEYGPYAGGISLMYEIALQSGDEEMIGSDLDVFEGTRQEIESVLNWIEEIQPNVNLGAQTDRRREPSKTSAARSARKTRQQRKRP